MLIVSCVYKIYVVLSKTMLLEGKHTHTHTQKNMLQIWLAVKVENTKGAVAVNKNKETWKCSCLRS